LILAVAFLQTVF